MARFVKPGCLIVVVLCSLALGFIVFFRTRSIDVDYKPLPHQPVDNSFHAVARLAARTKQLAEKSFALREGRRLLPDRGDEKLRSEFMEAILDVREQYLPLIGKPFMPPKRFSVLEQPYETEGVGYWVVAESVVLDNLLAARKFDEAANHLERTIVFSQQLASHTEFVVAAMSSFMQHRSFVVLRRHFAQIPAPMCGKFAGALVAAEARARPVAEMIDASEAATIKFLMDLHDSADTLYKAYFDYRKMARDAKAAYEDLRIQSRLPIAKRNLREPTGALEDLTFDDGLGMRIYDRPRYMSRLLAVAFEIRHFRHTYRRYPTTLAELKLGEREIDPFTGEPLIYKVGPKGFLLYARGDDGDDDGGVRGLGHGDDGDVGVFLPTREELRAKPGTAPPLWLK
jgi:hypothetical protein